MTNIALDEQFFDLANDMLCVANTKGYFLRVNPAFEQTLGYPQDALLSVSFLEFVHPDDREETQRALQKLAQGQDIQTFINRYRHQDGHYLWLSWSSRPRKNGLLYAAARDITEMMDYQRELEGYAQEISTIFERISDAVFALNTDWAFTYLNPQAEKLLQRKRGDLLGKHIWTEFPEAVGLPFYDAYHKAMQTQQTVTFTAYFTPLDTWFDVRAYPSRNGLSVFLQDVTERIRAEQQLLQREAQYRLLIDNFPNGIVALYDLELRYTFVGGSVFEYARTAPADWVGKRLDELFAPEVAQRDMPKLEAALQGERTVADEVYQGQHYRVFTLPIKDPNGEIIGGMVMTQDMTEQYLNQQRAVQLQQEAARRHVLQRFVQDASHEFRTPLARINTNAYLMMRSDDPDQRNRYRQDIESLVSAIAHLVDELNELTTLDTQPDFTPQACDLNALLGNTLNELRPEASEKALSVNLTPYPAPANVPGDPDRLQTALHNVLENAVRYTKPGGDIAIQVHKVGSAYVIHIEDTGPGIAPEHLPQIFERFYRADEAHSTPGFGLGLAIAQAVIEGHQGHIHARNRSEGGSCFEIRLPQHIPD